MKHNTIMERTVSAVIRMAEKENITICEKTAGKYFISALIAERIRLQELLKLSNHLNSKENRRVFKIISNNMATRVFNNLNK